MNKEIKEILDNIKNKYTDYYVQDIVSNNDLKILLDYITNLQQELEEEKRIEEADLHKIQSLEEENERFKKALNCKEYFSATMPEDTEFVILTKNNYDRQQKDIQLELIDYKLRCDKAIEYIENYKNVLEEGINKGADYLYLGSPLNKLEELYSILQGEKE